MGELFFLTGELRNIVKVASVYVATIIGAGFASGQEIVQFFSNYYRGGFYGIILAGILFSLIGYVVLDKVYRERIRNYDELLFPAVGWFAGWIIEAVISVFMLSVFCIMISGSGSILTEKLDIPYDLSVIIMAVVCMCIILTDMKGMLAISTITTPLLIVGITVVGLFTIVHRDSSVFSISGSFTTLTHNWFFSALTYVGYNSIISMVVMSGLLPYLKSRRVGVVGGILGGLVLCFIAFILNTAMFVFHPDVLAKELPVLSITEKYNTALSGFYASILWLAMFVSAITSGYCFVDRVGSKININKKLAATIICLVAIPLSKFSFSNLISTLYPLFGYIGLFVLLVVFIQGVRFRKGHFLKK